MLACFQASKTRGESRTPSVLICHSSFRIARHSQEGQVGLTFCITGRCMYLLPYSALIPRDEGESMS